MAGTLVITTLSDGTNSTSATNCIQGSAKAWVNYTYFSSTLVITASYNISSITRTASGRYYADFTNAMSDANYAAMGSGSVDPSAGAFTTFVNNATGSSPYYIAPTTTRFYFSQAVLSTGGGLDALYGSIAVFD
jgi:hypothetical protein